VIVHINEMADKSDNTSGTTPLYRERTPKGAPKRAPMAAPKAAENTAKPGADTPKADANKPGEVGGPKGPEPTRYGDWERDGRCVDF
jgi:hypothetical protein